MPADDTTYYATSRAVYGRWGETSRRCGGKIRSAEWGDRNRDTERGGKIRSAEWGEQNRDTERGEQNRDTERGEQNRDTFWGRGCRR